MEGLCNALIDLGDVMLCGGWVVSFRLGHVGWWNWKDDAISWST